MKGCGYEQDQVEDGQCGNKGDLPERAGAVKRWTGNNVWHPLLHTAGMAKPPQPAAFSLVIGDSWLQRAECAIARSRRPAASNSPKQKKHHNTHHALGLRQLSLQRAQQGGRAQRAAAAGGAQRPVSNVSQVAQGGGGGHAALQRLWGDVKRREGSSDGLGARRGRQGRGGGHAALQRL